MHRPYLCGSLWTVAILSLTPVAPAAELGTAFTYQGTLEDGSGPVTASCDFRFKLWDDADPGAPDNQIGPTLTFDGAGGNPPTVAVANGLFSVALDFGASAIDGTARWLEIEVCCPHSPPCTLQPLSPRVELKPVPHALALPGVYTIQEPPSVAGITPPPGLAIRRTPNAVTSTVSIEAINSVGLVALQLKSGNDAVMGYDPTVGEAVFQAPNGVRAGSVKIDSSLAANVAGPGSSAELVVTGDVLELKVDGNTVDRWSALGVSPFGLSPNRIGGSPDNMVVNGIFGATIAGGGAPTFANTVNDIFGTIAGGRKNTAAIDAFIGGGNGNTASGAGSTVGGGVFNEASEFAATIAGGRDNVASGTLSTIGGGRENVAGSHTATVGGGQYNQATGTDATVGGGAGNTASGYRATIPGGADSAAGGDYSFAAGRRAKVRTAAQSGDADGDNGTFVWADSTDADFTSAGPNQFLIRASGGVGIGTTALSARLHVDTGGGTGKSLWCEHVGSNLIVRPLTSGGDDTVIENTGGGSLVLNPNGGSVGVGRNPTANKLEVEGEASKTSAGDWVANSDAAIKTQVRSVSDALSTIARLRPVAFRYTDDYKARHPSVKDQDYYNYIAQEFRQVFPDWVQDSGEDGVLQMDAYPASVYAVAAIQELHQIVQEKDCEIGELKDRNDELEARLAKIEALLGKTVSSKGEHRD